MRVVLEVTEGPYAGRKLLLQTGQIGEVGRSEQADLSIPTDFKMSGLHFAVVCQSDGCQLRDLASTNGTLLHGERVAEAVLHDGDRIQAGDTTFSVTVEVPGSATGRVGPTETARPEPAPAALPASPSSTTAATLHAAGGPAEAPTEPASLAELCQRAQLDVEAQQLLQPDQSLSAFVQRLVEHDRVDDCLRLLAQALPKRRAVQWACQCVRRGCGDQLSPADEAALEAAERWAQQPSEDHRRATMAAAETLQYATAASWAAMGAFWSGGSMAPANAPDVPPDPSLTGQALHGAVALAAVAVEAEKAPEKQRSFLQQGLDLATKE